MIGSCSYHHHHHLNISSSDFVVGVLLDDVPHLLEHLRQDLAGVIGALHHALLKLALELLHLLVSGLRGHLVPHRVLAGEGAPL